MVGMLASGAAVMGIALPAQRFVPVFVAAFFGKGFMSCDGDDIDYFFVYNC